MKKGTGSEPNRPGAAGTTVPRRACTLFPRAWRHNFVKYVNGYAADLGLAAGNRLLVLTGEPGSAKSTLMRHLLTGIIEPPVALSWFSTRLRGVAEL